MAFCQNKTQVTKDKEAEDVRQIQAIIERVKRNKGRMLPEDFQTLTELFRQPNPPVAAVIVTERDEGIAIGFPMFLSKFRREEFRKSLLELCESPDQNIAERVVWWLVVSAPTPEGRDYLTVDITNPWEFLRTDRHYIFRHLKACKELPQRYVDTIYSASPAMSLAAMFYAHHLVQYKDPERADG